MTRALALLAALACAPRPPEPTPPPFAFRDALAACLEQHGPRVRWALTDLGGGMVHFDCAPPDPPTLCVVPIQRAKPPPKVARRNP